MDEEEVVELPEEKVVVSPKPAGKSKAKGKGKGKAKCKKKDCSYLCTPDNKETSAVAPGIGQKTAFKKLGKLKGELMVESNHLCSCFLKYLPVDGIN